MLQLNQSRIVGSVEHKLATGVSLAEEGTALVTAYENNQLVVKPSTGTSGEVFAGIALSAVASVISAPIVEEHKVPAKAPFTVELADEPITDSEIFVRGFTKNASAESGKFALDGKTLTFDASDAGKTVVVTYAYSPRLNQLTAFQGDQAPGVHVTTALGQTGVITAGNVFTSAYDVTADWTPKNGAIKVYLGANGKFTTKEGGTQVPAIVTNVPAVGSPFLGLQFHI